MLKDAFFANSACPIMAPNVASRALSYFSSLLERDTFLSSRLKCVTFIILAYYLFQLYSDSLELKRTSLVN